MMLVIVRIPLGAERQLDLHITVPENLCFTEKFDDLFAAYTKSHRLVKTRTGNMGSLYKLLYGVEMKDERQIKDFIDQLRCRNGNLEIEISHAEGGDEL